MNFAWIDVETTGLDPDKDLLLSVGLIVTDPKLRELARQEWILNYTTEQLEPRLLVNPVAREMHVKSGLLTRVTTPEGAWLYAPDVDKELSAVLRATSATQLAGNSVHFDRGFLKRELFATNKLLQYRHLDVSVFKILASAWDWQGPAVPSPAHTSMGDLEQCLKDFKFWCEEFDWPVQL